jgi:transposase
VGVTSFDGHPSSGVCPRKDVRSWRAWGRSPRRRRSFTSEFKAEIVELCQRGDRSAGQVAKDFDLTETAVREWVKQAERDAGARQDGGLTSAERRELAELRRENRLNGPPRCRRSRPEPDIAKYDSRCTPRF